MICKEEVLQAPHQELLLLNYPSKLIPLLQFSLRESVTASFFKVKHENRR
jgi:hypothetical protein